MDDAPGMKLLAVYTTVATPQDARRLAEAAVRQGLAACVQLCAVDSFYSWNGSLEHAAEVRLMLKTTDASYDALEKLLLERHPYQLPAIYAMEVHRAHSPYAMWVNENTGAARNDGTDAGWEAPHA